MHVHLNKKTLTPKSKKSFVFHTSEENVEFCICLCVYVCTLKPLLFSSFSLLSLAYIIEVVKASSSVLLSFLEEPRAVVVV